MKVIGLTGGIGSGKSTVSRFLEELGAVIIDADKVGHEAFEPGVGLWQAVVAAFGERILDNDGKIDRKKLGEIVFSDPAKRSQLNEIMHPGIYDIVLSRIEGYRRQGIKVLVLEVPLLIEGVGDWVSLVDEIWVTVAAEESVLTRLQERSGFSEEEVQARIRSQLSNEERIKHADVVIYTDCSLDEVKAKVKLLWERRLS